MLSWKIIVYRAAPGGNFAFRFPIFATHEDSPGNVPLAGKLLFTFLKQPTQRRVILSKRSASKDLLVSIGRRSFDSHSLPQDDKTGRLDYCFGVLYRRGRVSRPWDFAKQNPIAARQSMVTSFGNPENANIFGWDGKPVPYGVD